MAYLYKHINEKTMKKMDKQLASLSDEEIETKANKTTEIANKTSSYPNASTVIKAIPAMVTLGTLGGEPVCAAVAAATFLVGSSTVGIITESSAMGVGVTAGLMAGVSYLSFKTAFRDGFRRERLFEEANYMRETVKKRKAHSDSLAKQFFEAKSRENFKSGR